MSIFSQGEFESGTYRWRRDGRILVTIISQPFCLGDTDKEKIRETDKEGKKVDIDAVYLKKFFEVEKAKFPATVDYRFEHSITYDAFIKKYVNVMENETENYEQYDCFFFFFLTYIGEKSVSDEKLHFYDCCKPLGDVLDAVKEQEVTWGKPKIFLIQADDKTLLVGKKTKPKGGPVVVTEKKIPQDADRLIILSTIPQKIANKKTESQSNQSFLVQAFVKTMKNNWNLREDFLSLTTTINGMVSDMITASGDERKDDMPVPLVTSTLTKALML